MATRNFSNAYDLDGTDSPTPSDPDSDVERFERDPKPLSPRSGSRRFREKIRELGGKLPAEGEGSTGSKFLDGSEDFAVGLGGRLKAVRKVWSKGRVESEADVGIGGVIIDQPGVGAEYGGQPTNSYRDWQLQRQFAGAQAVPVQQHQTQSPVGRPLSNMGLFAKLPGELRNRLYRLTLLTPTIEEPFLITMQPATCSLGPCVHAKLPTAVPGLLSSCQQIRQEAMPIFCTENVFKFDTNTVRDRCTANWVRALGHYGSLVRCVILDVMVWEEVMFGSLEKVGRVYEVKLGCPAGIRALRDEVQCGGRFILHVDTTIRDKAREVYWKLREHVRKLNERMEQNGEGSQPVTEESLLVEFLWSDWVAELVYRCKK